MSVACSRPADTLPERLAARYPLPDLMAKLSGAPAHIRAVILAAINIHLDRLWRPLT